MPGDRPFRVERGGEREGPREEVERGCYQLADNIRSAGCDVYDLTDLLCSLTDKDAELAQSRQDLVAEAERRLSKLKSAGDALSVELATLAKKADDLPDERHRQRYRDAVAALFFRASEVLGPLRLLENEALPDSFAIFDHVRSFLFEFSEDGERGAFLNRVVIDAID